MIEGFEKETGDLTREELAYVPKFVEALSRRIGKSEAITSDTICEGLTRWGMFRNYSVKWTGPRLRKLVNYCVVNDLIKCLVATGKGYYIAETYDECISYQRSLEGRVSAIQSRVEAIRRQSSEAFAPRQASLF